MKKLEYYGSHKGIADLRAREAKRKGRRIRITHSKGFFTVYSYPK